MDAAQRNVIAALLKDLWQPTASTNIRYCCFYSSGTRGHAALCLDNEGQAAAAQSRLSALAGAEGSAQLRGRRAPSAKGRLGAFSRGATRQGLQPELGMGE